MKSIGFCKAPQFYPVFINGNTFGKVELCTQNPSPSDEMVFYKLPDASICISSPSQFEIECGVEGANVEILIMSLNVEPNYPDDKAFKNLVNLLKSGKAIIENEDTKKRCAYKINNIHVGNHRLFFSCSDEKKEIEEYDRMVNCFYHQLRKEIPYLEIGLTLNK